MLNYQSVYIQVFFLEPPKVDFPATHSTKLCKTWRFGASDDRKALAAKGVTRLLMIHKEVNPMNTWHNKLGVDRMILGYLWELWNDYGKIWNYCSKPFPFGVYGNDLNWTRHGCLLGWFTCLVFMGQPCEGTVISPYNVVPAEIAKLVYHPMSYI